MPRCIGLLFAACMLAPATVRVHGAPAGADYVENDGTIRINGADHVKPILEDADGLFSRSHGGVRFDLELKGTSSAMPALTHGVTFFAPMGREVSPLELVPYGKIVGCPPVEIRVAHDSNGSTTLATSLAVYVNRANPIDQLSTEQLVRIFTTGAPKGDITRWGQAGVAGEWARRPIHPVGTPTYTGFGDYLERHLYDGRPLAPSYEIAPETNDILARIASDPAAIGIAAIGREGPQIKPVGSPIGRFLYFYVRRLPGQPVDPLVKDYFHLLLSPEGQRIFAAHGYPPLTRTEAEAEAAKLDSVAPDADEAVGPPKMAPHDGSVYIVGNDGMQDFTENLDALYAKAHPDTQFTLNLKGSSTGIGGLTAGVSEIAPMGRDAWPVDLSGYKEVYGNAPVDLRIGYDGFTHEKGKSPPGIYVNEKNPLASLTVRQMARIFTSGSPKGDVTHWAQLGLKGAWARRVIHVYGLPDDGGFATALRITLMSKLPFAHSYEALPKNADIAEAIAADPFGIALISFFNAKAVPGIRMLPLAAQEGAPAVLPTYENVHAGRYPLVPYLHLYLVRTPDHPASAFALDYARAALSPEGQAILAAERDSEDGYVPLNPADIPAERAKLNSEIP